MRRLSFSLCTLALLLGAGCGSTTREVDATDRGEISVDHIGGNEVEDAVKDLAQKILRKNKKGWPAHVRLSEDGLPVLRIGTIANETRMHFNTDEIKNEIYNTMLELDVVYFAAQADDATQIHAERDYSASGMTDKTIDHGDEDAVGLVLTGEVSDDVIVGDNGTKQHDYWFSLRLVDTTKNRVILTTRTKMRKVKR